MSPYLRTLRRVALFNELSDVELDSLSQHLLPVTYSANQFVFTERDRGSGLLIVHQGIIRVLKASPAGRMQLLSLERAGSTLGEVSLFDGGTYSTTAVAATPAIVLRLDGARFLDLCAAHPGIPLKVIRVLAHRLRVMRSLVEELSFTTVRQRLIAHLLRLAEAHDAGPGVRIVLNENNEELAARLGTVRELISRNLGRLHAEGLIVMERRVVRIPRLDLLRAELTGKM